MVDNTIKCKTPKKTVRELPIGSLSLRRKDVFENDFKMDIWNRRLVARYGFGFWDSICRYVFNEINIHRNNGNGNDLFLLFAEDNAIHKRIKRRYI